MPVSPNIYAISVLALCSEPVVQGYKQARSKHRVLFSTISGTLEAERNAPSGEHVAAEPRSCLMVAGLISQNTAIPSSAMEPSTKVSALTRRSLGDQGAPSPGDQSTSKTRQCPFAHFETLSSLRA